MNDAIAIVCAIRNYDMTFRCLPVVITAHDGQPLYSWRFAIYPFVESTKLSYALDASWDDDGNAEVRRLKPSCYYTASREVYLAAITGPDAAMGSTVKRFDDLPTDVILTITRPGIVSHWMEPGDIDESAAKSVNEFIVDDKYICVGFADGVAWLLSKDTPIASLKEFFTVTSAAVFDREKVLGGYCISRRAIDLR